MPSETARRWLPSREVLTFLAVGGAGYVVDVLAFNLLRTQPALAAHDPAYAKVLAVAAAMVVTYLGNRMLTWRGPSADRGREVGLFVLFNVVGLGISVATLLVSHDLLGLTSRLADNLSANVLGLGLGTLFRYWAYRRFVFAAAEPDAVTIAPARLTPALDRPSLVHVVSGSFGAGHDAAAREIALRLTDAGHDVRRCDVVDLFPAGIGRLLRWGYLAQLRLSPGSWGLLLRHLRPGSLGHRLAVGFLALPTRRLARIADGGGDLFVSTHPFASQALGRLRRTGRLEVPAVTYLTDASVHPLWVGAGVDLHLALHDVAAEQARALGGHATVIQPLVPRDCQPRSGESVWELRSRLDLPVEDDLALVVGGAFGIGELAEAAADVLATGLARPVVVCGHNDQLRHRLGADPGVIALGWRDDVPDLIRASSCVVQNSGGFTSLESLASGVPVISYRCLPGHGAANAAALEETGLAPWAHDPDDLRRLLAAAVDGDRTVTVATRPAPDLVSALSAAPVAVAS